MTDKPTDYGWIAWRTKRGWSVTHAVVGADTVDPEECRGYYTMCRLQIPEDALEVVGAGRRGVARSRLVERIAGAFRVFILGVDSEFCRHCWRAV